MFNPTTEFQKQQATKVAMMNAAAESCVVIAALSKELFNSAWCLAELTAAAEAGVPVVPVFALDYISIRQMEDWVAGKGICQAPTVPVKDQSRAWKEDDSSLEI